MTMRTAPQMAQWLAQNPGGEAWVADQDRQWDQALAYREQGYTVGQSAALLDQVIEPQDDDVDVGELRAQLSRQAESIAQQAATITRGMADNERLTSELSRAQREAQRLTGELDQVQREARRK